MDNELFGVFGNESRFRRHRAPDAFDRVVSGEAVTVGVRDAALGVPNRTDFDVDDDGVCVVWGEVFPPPGRAHEAASWFRERFAERGAQAFAELNGSYLVVIERDGEAVVAADPIRSIECFHTDAPGDRVFGTDPVAVARTIDEPEVDKAALLELVHLSVVTGDRTVIQELNRVPFDGFLEARGAGEFARFVYEPREFDYVGELADRLERAMIRRADLPGRKGLLLSGGYDSRTIVAGLDGLDRSYTIGHLDGAIVDTARQVSRQYGVDHRALPIDDRYLHPEEETIQYGQGIKESIHIHQAGYTADIEVDTVYHALLFDTLFRGHFLPRDNIELLGHAIPRSRLDPDPGIADTLLERFAFIDDSEAVFPDSGLVDADSSEAFLRSVIDERGEALSDRSDSVHDLIALIGIENQPTMPFRTHLSDTHLESFIAADAELLEWHLSTPPEHRNTRTFIEAMQRLDPEILRHPPHNRPHRSPTMNGLERFLRRKLPFFEPFDPAWPNRGHIYERRNLDDRLFGPHPEVRGLPFRLKLRVNDAMRWLEMAVDDLELQPIDVLRPAVDSTVSRRSSRPLFPATPSNE